MRSREGGGAVPIPTHVCASSNVRRFRTSSGGDFKTGTVDILRNALIINEKYIFRSHVAAKKWMASEAVRCRTARSLLAARVFTGWPLRSRVSDLHGDFS